MIHVQYHGNILMATLIKGRQWYFDLQAPEILT